MVMHPYRYADYGSIAAFVAVLGFFLLIILAYSLVCYILASIGLYSMGKRRGFTDAWVAWIPGFGKKYCIGRHIGSIQIGSLHIPQAQWVLSLGSIVLGMLGSVIGLSSGMLEVLTNAGNPSMIMPTLFAVLGGSGLVSLLGLAFYVLGLIASYQLYKLYRPDNAVLYLILSIIGFQWIVLFLLRNHVPENMEPPVQSSPYHTGG